MVLQKTFIRILGRYKEYSLLNITAPSKRNTYLYKIELKYPVLVVVAALTISSLFSSLKDSNIVRFVP